MRNFLRRGSSLEAPTPTPEEFRDQERLRLRALWEKCAPGPGEKYAPWSSFSSSELDLVVEFLCEENFLPGYNNATLRLLVENVELSSVALQHIADEEPTALADSVTRYHFVTQENLPRLVWMTFVRNFYSHREPERALPGRPVLSDTDRDVLQRLNNVWLLHNDQDFLRFWDEVWAMSEGQREIFLALLEEIDWSRDWHHPQRLVDEARQVSLLV